MQLNERKINRVVDETGALWEEVITVTRKEVFSPISRLRDEFLS